MLDGHSLKQTYCKLLARVWVKEKNIVGIEPKAGAYLLLAAGCNLKPVIPVSGFMHGITLIPPGTSFTALAGLISGEEGMP